jgi:thymidylate kinase
LKLVRQAPERWVVVDARQPWEQVQQALRQVILKKIQ